ncbi:MAG TPA: Ldh family oxidoreductase [Candidatus Saccharimonadales bacterium]|nr:Ldh family oxidoreductase [Candidatus Saccharimonadales bacterium]
MLIKISKLKTFIKQIILTEYTDEEAELMTDVILFGELSGKPSHGLLRLLKENFGVFIDGKREKPHYIHKTKVSTLIDSKGNPGFLVGPLAMQEVIKLAKKNGVGIVGTKKSINTTGAISYYCEKIARENLLCIIFPQSYPLIAPFNSKTALFGTNPIGFGIPADPKPIIFDMSTAAIAWGTVMKHQIENVPLPENVAIDQRGELTTDPKKAKATLAFGASYKGSGLAMMVEIFGGLWTGASYGGNHIENGHGNLFMAFSPDLLNDTETFKKHAEELVEILHSKKTKDNKKLRIPGENALTIRDNHLEKGVIEINDAMIEKLKERFDISL